MFLIDDIFTAPAKGLFSIFKAIHDRVEDEMYDPEKIKNELMQLQLKYDMGEISDDEYDDLEEELLDRLSEAQKRLKSK